MSKFPEGINPGESFSREERGGIARDIFGKLESGIKARPEFQAAATDAFFNPPGEVPFSVGNVDYSVEVHAIPQGNSGKKKTIWVDKKDYDTVREASASAYVHYETDGAGRPQDGQISLSIVNGFNGENTREVVEKIPQTFSDIWPESE